MGTRVLTGASKLIFILCIWVSILVTISQIFHIGFIGQIMQERAYLALMAGLILPLVFLVFPGSEKAPRDRVPWYDYTLAGLSIFGPGFMLVLSNRIMESDWMITPPPVAMVLGMIMWALVLEGIRRTAGWFLCAFVGIFSLYPLVAGSLPGPFLAKSYTLSRLVGYHFVSQLSMFGLPLQIFGQLLLGFLAFGVALQTTGAGAFLLNIAQSLVGRMRGGPALVSVVASSFMASLSGSSVANVVAVGSVTIPAMKKSGVESHVAAAIEVCASTGGILTPPVMGATAFIMAAMLEVPYYQVAIAAAMPMFIYYASMFGQIYCYAQRQRLPATPRDEIPSFKTTFAKGWFYLGSIVVLVYLLFYIKVESWAPYYATVFLFLCALIRKETRPNMGTFYKFTVSLGDTFVRLLPPLVGVGMFIGAMSLTGIGQSFADILLIAGQGNLYLIMLMGAAGAWFLGLGMTITPCYIFMALIFVPALTKLGVLPMAAHLFFLYWGMISEITPPVGFPIFVSAAIANAPVMRVGWEATRMGMVRYIIPFLFVLNPALVAHGTVPDVAWATSLVTLGVLIIGAALVGYVPGIGKIGMTTRIVLAASGFLLVYPSNMSVISGGLLFAAAILTLVFLRRSSPGKGA